MFFFQSIGLKTSCLTFSLWSISIFWILNFLLNHFSKQFDKNFNSIANIWATVFLHRLSETLMAQSFSRFIKPLPTNFIWSSVRQSTVANFNNEWPKLLCKMTRFKFSFGWKANIYVLFCSEVRKFYTDAIVSESI